MQKVSKQLAIDEEDLNLRISDLIIHGLLKWETDVEVTASKSGYNKIVVDAGVSNNDIFIFTPL